MDKSRVSLGRWGEERVARDYESRGYRLLDRNWQMRGGELDLVLEHGDTIVFCEVKTRSSAAFGSGAESVGHRKQGFLRRTAVAWLREHERRGELRFDVATVTAGKVEVIEGAF